MWFRTMCCLQIIWRENRKSQWRSWSDAKNITVENFKLKKKHHCNRVITLIKSFLQVDSTSKRMEAMEANGTSNMTSTFNFVNLTNAAEDEGRDVKTLAMSYIIFKIR